MQLLAEAPAIALNARDGVVAEVQLVQGCEAVEGAAVHLHQAVVLQVPAKTTHRMKRLSSSRYPGGQAVSDVVLGAEKVTTERSMHILHHVQHERKFKQ